MKPLKDRVCISFIASHAYNRKHISQSFPIRTPWYLRVNLRVRGVNSFVTLAAPCLQMLAIKDADDTSAVTNCSLFLECTCRYRNGSPSAAKHARQSFLG